MAYVYHSSKIQDLKTIEPRVSTHGSSWVYAMKKRDYSLVFLGNHGDMINQTGFEGSMPYIAERFEGALEYAYENQSGSIYYLEAEPFKADMTSFKHEVVCDHTCDVIEEEKIENVLEKILGLETEGKIVLYRYPTLPPWLKADKSDIIDQYIVHAKTPGSTVLERMKKFHPDIYDEFVKRLEE